MARDALYLRRHLAASTHPVHVCVGCQWVLCMLSCRALAASGCVQYVVDASVYGGHRLLRILAPGADDGVGPEAPPAPATSKL
eukprot:COSAG01_NODE_1505_length_10091_cov_18.350781_3_plen_83_part_00